MRDYPNTTNTTEKSMRIYAIRRANVDAYKPGKGASDYDVTETGRHQALFLANHFARQGIEFDAIYTGSSSRHQKTAALIAEMLGVLRGQTPAVIDFDGINDTQWTEEALRACYDRNLRQATWIREWANGNIETDETLAEARKRLRDAKATLVNDHEDDGTLLLVTSAIPLQLFVEDAVGITVEETQFPAYNTGIFEFEWGTDESELIQLNAIPHLSENMTTRGYFVDSS